MMETSQVVWFDPFYIVPSMVMPLLIKGVEPDVFVGHYTAHTREWTKYENGRWVLYEKRVVYWAFIPKPPEPIK